MFEGKRNDFWPHTLQKAKQAIKKTPNLTKLVTKSLIFNPKIQIFFKIAQKTLQNSNLTILNFIKLQDRKCI